VVALIDGIAVSLASTSSAAIARAAIVVGTTVIIENKADIAAIAGIIILEYNTWVSSLAIDKRSFAVGSSFLTLC
jgi:hypothetical protein